MYNWYFWIKFLHVITAMIFVGGLLGRQVVRANARKTDDVQLFASLSHAAGHIENLMVIPGNLAVIVFGVILAFVSGYPILGFLQGAAQNWLLASNVLLVIGIVLVPTVFIPRGKKYAVILDAALAEGKMTAQLRATLADPLIVLAHRYEEVSLVIVVALMVLKPF